VPLDQSRNLQAEGEGVEPSRLIARPGSSRVPSPVGLPFRIIELRRQESNLRPPVNSRALVPARTPPESSRQTVGMAGFEPALSCSRSRRIGQAFPHPESPRSPTSAQRESNPHVRHGKAVGYRYIMGTIAVPELSKRAESTGWDSNPRPRLTRAESSPLDDQCLNRSGTGGARTLTEPVKSRTFCR
jgi:hypothetical protein